MHLKRSESDLHQADTMILSGNRGYEVHGGDQFSLHCVCVSFKNVLGIAHVNQSP